MFGFKRKYKYSNFSNENGLEMLKDMTEKLIKKENFFKNIVESANQGILVCSDQGIIEYCNQRAAKIIGYEIEDLLNKPVFNFMGYEQQEITKIKIKERALGLSENYDGKLVHKNGSTVWVSISATPIIESGEYIGSIVMTLDITDKMRYKFLFNVMELPVLIFDAGGVKDCNNGFVQLIKYENINDVLSHFEIILPDALATIKKICKEEPNKHEHKLIFHLKNGKILKATCLISCYEEVGIMVVLIPKKIK